MKNYIFILLTILLFSCSNDDVQETVSLPNYSSLSFSILEHPEKEKTIGSLNFSSDISNYQLTIVNQEPSNSFSIDNLTGELKVNENKNFDFDLNKEIQGKINVTVNNESKIIDLNIEIIERINRYSGNIDVSTQKQLDDFGANHYDFIDGNLRILTNEVTNLDALYNLKGVKELIIKDDVQINNFDGLRNLESVFKIHLQNLPNLKTTEVIMPKILSCSFIEINNTGLENLDGFSSFNFDLNNLIIKFNQELLNIDGLSNLTGSGQLLIESNSKLESVNLFNFDNTKNLFIVRNSSLSDFCGLQNLLKTDNSYNSAIHDNLFNPTLQDIIDGNCKQ